MYREDAGGALEPLAPWDDRIRRQDVRPLLTPNGTLYLVTARGPRPAPAALPAPPAPAPHRRGRGHRHRHRRRTGRSPRRSWRPAWPSRDAGSRPGLGPRSRAAPPRCAPSVPPCARTRGLEVTVAASGPAFDVLDAAGERPLRFALPDGSDHVPPGGDPAALLDAAAATDRARGPRTCSLVGISSLGVGLDEALLARAAGRPTFALQDYPGDANAVGGALRRHLLRARRGARRGSPASASGWPRSRWARSATPPTRASTWPRLRAGTARPHRRRARPAGARLLRPAPRDPGTRGRVRRTWRTRSPGWPAKPLVAAARAPEVPPQRPRASRRRARAGPGSRSTMPPPTGATSSPGSPPATS